MKLFIFLFILLVPPLKTQEEKKGIVDHVPVSCSSLQTVQILFFTTHDAAQHVSLPPSELEFKYVCPLRY